MRKIQLKPMALDHNKIFFQNPALNRLTGEQTVKACILPLFYIPKPRIYLVNHDFFSCGTKRMNFFRREILEILEY